ncbi:LysR family transcriptional regulator [Sphingomonas sp. DT-207]|uniref:LysR family transcriptional regulator n=1 Tax=Sphingomonas sp. DT-207 TaxID=3396167 RepID=UPI003F1E37AF
MQISRADLADFSYFLAIAKHRSFRRAGLELGVSASALSHALKGLETRLGVRLINRSSRSVTLTAAGEELRAAIGAPFDAIGSALEVLKRYREEPAGRIRLNVMEDASSLLLGPVLPTFVDRYPDIEVDVAVSNHLVDVIGEGADAGIRYGGTVPEDMIAQRLSCDFRWVVVGAPAYLGRFGTPEHSRDLAEHRCLRIRLGDDGIDPILWGRALPTQWEA